MSTSENFELLDWHGVYMSCILGLVTFSTPPSRDIVVCMNKVWFLLSCGRWFRLTLLITSSDYRECILTTAYALIEHSRFKRIALLLWKWHFDYRYVGILTNITCAYYHFHRSSIPDFESHTFQWNSWVPLIHDITTNSPCFIFPVQKTDRKYPCNFCLLINA